MLAVLDELLLVARDRLRRDEVALVMFAEELDGTVRPYFGHAERSQHQIGQAQARIEGLAHDAIDTEAMALLQNYPWPGNVRELRTAIEHAVVLSRGERISLRDLPAAVRGGAAGEPRLLPGKALTVKDAEKQLILRALKETDGNRTRAAEKIGMSRRTFHRKLHEYHLEGF